MKKNPNLFKDRIEIYQIIFLGSFWVFHSKGSHQRSSLEIVVLKNLAKFTGKQKASAFNFIKIETLAQIFSCEFCEIFKNIFFTENLRVTASVILATYQFNLQSIGTPDKQKAGRDSRFFW